MCVLLTPASLRQLFNDHLFYEQLQAGALRPRFDEESVVTFPDEPEPLLSQFVYYVNREHQLVALVHQYVRPDGTLAASGLPDPKWLIIDGVRHQLEPTAPWRRVTGEA